MRDATTGRAIGGWAAADAPEDATGGRRGRDGRRWGRALALAGGALLALAGCDDQVKYVETFATMVDGPAVETYEQQPTPPPEGAVPVTGAREEPALLVADTALTNPLQPTPSNIRAGQPLYRDFCLPCHGESGQGDGPVMNADGQHPERLPALPTADLTSRRARGLSDGYIYGMITNGRGLMPSYERIRPRERWQLVEYVRHLQRGVPGDGGEGQGGGQP